MMQPPKSRKSKLADIADNMVAAINDELEKNPEGFRKYPAKIGSMIEHLEKILNLITDDKT